MYLEQEAALLSEKYKKKYTGNKNQSKKHWKNLKI